MTISINQAIKVHKEGKLEEAERLYQKILETQPIHLMAINNLGVLLFSLGRLKEAEENYKKLIKLKPDFAEAYNNFAKTLFKLNRINEAVENHKKAIELKPNYIEAHNNLGTIMYKLDRLEEAQESYKKVIEFKPSSPNTYYNLGNISNNLDKLEDAEKNYKKAIELKPNFFEAYYNLANTLKDLDRLEDAEKNYKKAIEFKDDDAIVYNNLASTLEELGRYKEAEKNYKKAIELKPDFFETYISLAATLRKLNKLDESEEIYSKALNLKPGWKDALFGKGETLFEKKNFELALRDFDICNTSDSRWRSLTCLYALGKMEEIYERIEKYSDLDDKNLRVAAFSAFISYKQKKITKHNFCNNPIDFIHTSNISSHLKKSNLFINEAIKELGNVKTRWEPFGRTTFNGYHSGNKLNLFKNPQEKMNKLRSIILDEIDKYCLKFKNESCSFIKKWPYENDLFSWYINLKKQGYQTAHCHPSGWLSGVIYLKVVPTLDKNEGAIEFSLNGPHYSDDNSLKVIHKPKVGDIVLFPSSLYHRTIPFTTDTDRIIVSFDLIPNTKNN